MLSLVNGPVDPVVVKEIKIRETQALVDESLKIIYPSWPLQNSVAVNPFWWMRDQPFDRALRSAATSVHESLFLPLENYQELVQRGLISRELILQIWEKNRKELPAVSSVEELWRIARVSYGEDRSWIQLFSDAYQPERNWNDRFVRECGKYASEFFDDRQAIVKSSTQGQDFWSHWLELVRWDQSMNIQGLKRFHSTLEKFVGLSAVESIGIMLTSFGSITPIEKIDWMSRMAATVLGWGSQFRFQEWQEKLGYHSSTESRCEQILAVRFAYEYALMSECLESEPSQIEEWLRDLRRRAVIKEDTVHSFTTRIQSVLQTAWEQTYQEKITHQLANRPAVSENVTPIAQMVFCIDVRSEVLRRNLEVVSNGKIQTRGFAGFFGLPVSMVRADSVAGSNRLPVLLRSSIQCAISDAPQTALRSVAGVRAWGKKRWQDVQSELKTLRKGAFGSFSFVELFGLFFGFRTVMELMRPLYKKVFPPQTPPRFREWGVELKNIRPVKCDGVPFKTTEVVDQLFSVLTHLGLTRAFAPLVYLVGHGSQTVNNAQGASLDCGACGGNAGDINARLLADWLNRSEYRAGLRLRGIDVPDSTVFVPALHETVTDEVHLLEKPEECSQLKSTRMFQVNQVQDWLRQGSELSRQERLQRFSSASGNAPARRAWDWSEVRPEWGLAGNASFVIAPRIRTERLDLSGRAFLHDYDWRQDQQNGFKTLELILTAPVVVTSWINLQYYASTVAPRTYGSGNKTLHNLVNEMGVLEGNGGDLRLGLAMQSVHDGIRRVHDPLRLSVFVEAPQASIERIIEGHEVIRHLVENEWIHLLQIESEAGCVYRRKPGGFYEAVLGSARR